MNLSGNEFQIIFAVLILLALASVALIVDYLKSMNERLRERHVDLLARHETMVQRVEEDNTKLLRALAEQSKAFRDMTKRSIVVNTVVAEEGVPAIEMKPVAEIAGPAAEPDPEPPPAKEPDFDTFLEHLVTEFEAGPAATQDLEALSQQLAPSNLNIPLGAHAPATLNRILEEGESFTGLVVSIAINDYLKLDEIHGREATEKLLTTVDQLMSELVGVDGFCSRRSDDEFVLLFPGVTGSATQRCLSETSERLWDYQLQSLGTFNAVFTWGAASSVNQPLSEALALADDNMNETRSNRQSGTERRATA